jgi:hypothetical protein
VGFSDTVTSGMIMVWMSSEQARPNPTRRITPMHDLLIGLTFVGMVIAPAIVAAFSGTSETNPE